MNTKIAFCICVLTSCLSCRDKRSEFFSSEIKSAYQKQGKKVVHWNLNNEKDLGNHSYVIYFSVRYTTGKSAREFSAKDSLAYEITNEGSLIPLIDSVSNR